MISCKNVTELADRLVDGELGRADRARIHAHLFICVHCRRYVGQLRTTLSAVRARSWAQASQESTEQALALFRAEPSKDV